MEPVSSQIDAAIITLHKYHREHSRDYLPNPGIYRDLDRLVNRVALTLILTSVVWTTVASVFFTTSAIPIVAGAVTVVAFGILKACIYPKVCELDIRQALSYALDRTSEHQPCYINSDRKMMRQHMDSLRYAAWSRSSKVIDYKNPELREAVDLTYLFYRLAYFLQHEPNNHSLRHSIQVALVHISFDYKHLTEDQSLDLSMLAYKIHALKTGTTLTTALLSEMMQQQAAERAAKAATT